MPAKPKEKKEERVFDDKEMEQLAKAKEADMVVK